MIAFIPLLHFHQISATESAFTWCWEGECSSTFDRRTFQHVFLLHMLLSPDGKQLVDPSSIFFFSTMVNAHHPVLTLIRHGVTDFRRVLQDHSIKIRSIEEVNTSEGIAILHVILSILHLFLSQKDILPNPWRF